MPDREFRESIRALGEAALTDSFLGQQRVVRSALNDDGTVRPDALTDALPWQALHFRIPGVVTIGSSLGGIYELPQGGRIRRISARARVGPSSGPFTGRLVVNGEVEDSGSIQPGTSAIASGTSIAVPPGGIVTLNVTSAGGAEDVTVSVFYQSGGAT